MTAKNKHPARKVYPVSIQKFIVGRLTIEQKTRRIHELKTPIIIV